MSEFFFSIEYVYEIYAISFHVIVTVLIIMNIIRAINYLFSDKMHRCNVYTYTSTEVEYVF